MNFKIFKDKYENEDQYFKLMKRNNNNSIEVVAVNKNGIPLTGGCILNLSPEGLMLYGNLTRKIGILLDSKGYIQTINKIRGSNK